MNRKDLVKYIHAFTLGDGSLIIDKREIEFNPHPKAVFSTVKTEVNKDFIDYAESILKELTEVKVTYTTPKIGTGTKPYYRLYTRRHPLYTSIRDRMYIDNKKVVDPHYLTLMDWETLAILFMDDGTTWNIKDKKPYGTYDYTCCNICTQSFSYGDNLILAEAIKEKLDIHFYVRHQNLKSGIKYFLELSRKDNQKFSDGVGKYVLPSFYYKINKFNMTNSEKSDDDIV